MNELRWILLGVGILIVAGIYIWEVSKNRLSVRSRVEKYSAPHEDPDSYNIQLNPKKDSNIDIKGALDVFTSYLRQSKAEINDSVRPLPEENLPSEQEKVVNPVKTVSADPKSEIIAIYITAPENRKFNGDVIIDALENVDMEFGEMDIFHYYGPDKMHSTRALFSIANNTSPGTFDPDNIRQFTTRGLAMFMSLPAEIGGDIAFEIMYDTAQNISGKLGGELRGQDRQLLDSDKISRMRDIASRY